jgi:two-component system KDP operon response regulator KdpE
MSAGYQADGVASGSQGLRRILEDLPDAVILCLDISDMDGSSLLREIRFSFWGPVLALSAVNRQVQIIDALDLGADDFIAKPFGAGELLARLRAVFRRRLLSMGAKPVIFARDLMIDLVNRTVTVRGAPVALSEQQYWVLSSLAEAGGGVLTQWDFLVGSQTDAGVKSLQNMRFLIRQLREKLEIKPNAPEIIKTEHGVGYRLNINNAKI